MTCTSLTCLFCEESADFFPESDFAVSGVERNAIVLPSGDQTGDPAPFGVSVSGLASPPEAGTRTKPRLSDANTIVSSDSQTAPS